MPNIGPIKSAEDFIKVYDDQENPPEEGSDAAKVAHVAVHLLRGLLPLARKGAIHD